MKYNEFVTNKQKQPKRVGRGIAAGQGKTAGRGTKGQGARTGSKRRPGFEGGQNPLMQRLPKLHGFRSLASAKETVYTGQLDKLNSKTVDAQVLAKAGLITNPYTHIKLIVKGEVSKKLTVALPSASEAAIAAIQKAGGTFEKVAILARPATKKEEK